MSPTHSNKQGVRYRLSLLKNVFGVGIGRQTIAAETYPWAGQYIGERIGWKFWAPLRVSTMVGNPALKAGRALGGIPFTRGPLAHLLRNRFYLGEVAYRGEVFRGEQPAILDRDLFDAVQARLGDQRSSSRAAYAKSESLLIGRIHDVATA